MNFQCLFYFSSKSVDVMEVKRLGLSKNAPPSDVFQWLIFDHQKTELLKLTFQSMDKTDLLQKRMFKEAELQFNDVKAILNWNDKIIDLSVRNPQDAPLEHLKLR